MYDQSAKSMHFMQIYKNEYHDKNKSNNNNSNRAVIF